MNNLPLAIPDLEEFCEKQYEKLLPIMADKYEYEQRKKEKLEEVKARLDFGDARRKNTRAQESAYSESRTISPRRQRRSRSPRHNPSVFTRLRHERSRSSQHEYKSKARRESTVFKRLGSRGRSTSVHFDSRQESSRYTKNHSESEDSEGGHWKSKLRTKKSSVLTSSPTIPGSVGLMNHGAPPPFSSSEQMSLPFTIHHRSRYVAVGAGGRRLWGVAGEMRVGLEVCGGVGPMMVAGSDSQFESIADEVYTTFFENAEPEKAEPEKAEPEKAKPEKEEPEKPETAKTRNVEAQQDVLECSKKDNVQECSKIKEKEDKQDVHPDTEVISSSSHEFGYLEKSVPGSMKRTVSQKGPSKDLLNWYEDVNDEDEEEIDEDDDEIDEEDNEIDKEADDGKNDYDDELWSPKSIRTTSKRLISPKMKGTSCMYGFV
ncbi:hypothetical protein Tco_0688391 [Tanacetum coccineum]